MNMYAKRSLQANYLKKFQDHKQWILIYLKNGCKLQGQLNGFTDNAIFLKNSTRDLIYISEINTLLVCTDKNGYYFLS